jgi:prevent-host-death family protein
MTTMYKWRAAKERQVREPGAPVPATEFKAHCLELMEYVRETGREVLVTKHGKPVARLVPVPAPTQRGFGCMRGTVLWYGDIVSPVGDRWGEEG